MKPGTKPRKHNYGGRCLQFAAACALGVDWRDAPRGHDGPDGEERASQTTNEFWEFWEEELERYGYEYVPFQPDGKNEPDDFWIATVEQDRWYGDHRNSHAIVMKGRNFWYDPNHGRKRRPRKFLRGYKLVPSAD